MKRFPRKALAVSALVAVASLVAATPALAVATVSPTELVTGYYPGGSAYNPAGDAVAVAAGGQTDPTYPPLHDPEVDFIDVKTNTVTVLTDPALTSPISVVWSPDGTTLYVLNADTDIAVIDVATQTVVDNLSSGTSSSPYGLAITPDGNFLVVGDYSSANASALVEISTHNVTTFNYSSSYTVGTFVSPDGSKAYLVDYYGVVNVFDLSTPLAPPIDTLQFADMGYGSSSVCSSFDMSTLYMIDYMETLAPAYVSRLDLATGDSISTTTTAVGESIGCNMTPDGKNLLVASYGGDNPGAVAEFDGTTLDAVTTYTVSTTAYTDVIASSPKNCDVYVSNFEETTNILNFPCGPELPNTGVNAVAFAAMGGFALVAIAAGTFVLVARRRKS